MWRLVLYGSVHFLLFCWMIVLTASISPARPANTPCRVNELELKSQEEEDVS